MGYLLKEALKTLCGVNQWSYAVFWKIGCQNPKLLIWEECYDGPITYPCLPQTSGIENEDIAFNGWEARWVSSEARTSLLRAQAGDRVQMLVDKMMMDNQVNIVGEGLVGRAAFTGNYQWILAQNYTRESHPPEVLNEVRQQLSSGMQTIAVIPVLPHGVIQFGSSSAIMENMGFVNDVKTLILQLGFVPGALFSENYASQDPATKVGTSIGLQNFASIDSSGQYKGADMSHCTSYFNDNYNQQENSQALSALSQTSKFQIRQNQDNLKACGPTFQASQSSGQPEAISVMKPKIGFGSQVDNGVSGAETIPSNPELWLNQEAPLNISGSTMKQHHSFDPLVKNSGSTKFLEQQMLVDAVSGNHNNKMQNDSNTFSSQWRKNGVIVSGHKGSYSALTYEPRDLCNDGMESHVYALSNSNSSSLSSAHRVAKDNVSSISITGSGSNNVAQYKTEVSCPGYAENLTTTHLLSDYSDHKHRFMDKSRGQVNFDEDKKEDVFQAISSSFPQLDEDMFLSGHNLGNGHGDFRNDYGYQEMGLSCSKFEDAYVQSGDDLFDILGLNFKDKLFNESHLFNEPALNPQTLDRNNYAFNKLKNACSESQVIDEGESGIFSMSGADHLLDPVFSKSQSTTNQSSDDNVSCKTSLTKLSSSSAPCASPSSGRANASNQLPKEVFGLSESLTKSGVSGSSSFKSGFCKEDLGNYSRTSSIIGSQISSWVEQAHDVKSSASASTAYSKRPDENSKSNRKRLKPGENPRPRPKDRQMIQDRVKELREIVPNGAKCSIDALLERTIKHMLFLQSVTKHADKLKHTGDSKIISDEGGLLLKDNFERGATWAYEAGSQSMVCPIIVEDLNPPRQMLVEMLCEERGLFLEIADIVRGLGLTILKGVMENRKGKIWARFSVEANRDVTRMEIFVSVVRLLEQTIKTTSAPINCIGNDQVAVPQPFHQAACIRANGMPRSIQ